MSAWAIVVAAGRGQRLGLGYNKVFYPLAGRTVLSRCLDALLDSACFEGIILVLSAGDEAAYEECVRREGACGLVRFIVQGGATRQESVYNGLMKIPPQVEVVAVHDAARPFAAPALIRETVRSAREFGSGVAATQVKDTITMVDESGYAVSTPNRSFLRAVQTPQVFMRDALVAAHKRAAADKYTATDDAALMQKYSGAVRLVETQDSGANIKLTTQEDLRHMEAQMTSAHRIGFGWDAHKLVEGRRLVLCGVDVPYEKGLLGHSDADVAVHALMDALLGAMGEGDIGRHFPDSDNAYKGISSMLLLEKVMALAAEKGYSLGNVDVTIVAQRPKLAPYMAAMREALCRAMNLPDECVNIKATTSERMGFEGREEGISASAVAMMRRG